MVGTRIKEFLESKGIKQSFLSKQTGISENAISDICIHDRKIDCIEYYKICNALDVPLDFFLKDL